jgi:hypothetical protein
MKKLVSILLILSFAILILPTKVLAQEETTTTVEAGVTTESPFYFLDRWLESIELFFTPQEKKSEKQLQFAEERLAEMEEVADTATPDELEVLGEQYQKDLDEIELGEGVTEEVQEKVREARQRHIQVLERVRENAPEEAQQTMEQVVQRARERVENQVVPGEVNQGDQLEEVEEEIEKQGFGEKIKEAFDNVVNRGRDTEEDVENDQTGQGNSNAPTETPGQK